MEVKIGVQHAPRELSVETDSPAEDVLDALDRAIADNGVFTLTDTKGHVTAVPAAKVAYVQVLAEAGRKVGFGLVAHE